MKIIFPLLLFLNLTGTYRILAALINVPVSYVSSIILILLAFWILLNLKSATRLTKNSFFAIALLLIFLWPCLTLFYTPEIFIKRIALQLYYLSLFWGTIIFLMKYGIARFARINSYSYWTAISGLLASFLFPDLFTRVATISAATTDYYGRAFGFMLQPNMAITNLSLLFICHCGLAVRKKKIFGFLATGAYVLAIILTGSRTGVVIMLFLAAIYTQFFFKNHLHIKYETVAFKRTLFSKFFISLAVILVIISTISVLWTYIETHDLIKTNQSGFGLRERVNNYLHGKLSSSGISRDKNLHSRFDFQKQYLFVIAEKPFVGYGIGSRLYMRETEKLPFASHSQYIDLAVEFGIFYPAVFFLFFFLIPILYKKRQAIENNSRSNWILQICLSITLLSIVSNTVLSIRTPWPIMGLVFYCLYVWEHPNTKVTSEQLVKRKICFQCV